MEPEWNGYGIRKTRQIAEKIAENSVKTGGDLLELGKS